MSNHSVRRAEDTCLLPTRYQGEVTEEYSAYSQHAHALGRSEISGSFSSIESLALFRRLPRHPLA